MRTKSRKPSITQKCLAGAAAVLAAVMYGPSGFAAAPAASVHENEHTTTASAPVTEVIEARTTDLTAALAAARARGRRFLAVDSVAADAAATPDQSAACAADPVRNAWLVSRFEACANTTGQLRVIEVRTRKQIGAMVYTVHADLQTRTGSKEWPLHLWFTRNSAWGAARGAEITGSGKASGGRISGTIPAQPLGASGKAQAAFTVTSAVARSKILGGGATATWNFLVPGATPSNPVSLRTPTVRCDNALKGYPTSYGCVVPDARIGIAYSLSGPYAEVAKHIRDAQRSGLPGAWGSKTYLTRLTDDTLIERNRNRACPSSLPRPPGDSCDEYPFASTYQGASLSGGRFSRRMLNDTQNTSAGRALNGFYATNRVLTRDPFQVEIVA